MTVIGLNSLHHQAVKRLGIGLRAVGYAPDGVVETFEGEARPSLWECRATPRRSGRRPSPGGADSLPPWWRPSGTRRTRLSLWRESDAATRETTHRGDTSFPHHPDAPALRP